MSSDDGDQIAIASDDGGQFLLMCGEPIVMGGGSVMNTDDEIKTAFDDDQSGVMGQLAANRREGVS